MIGFIKAGVLVAIRIFRRRQIPMMRQMIAIVDARDRSDRAKHEDIRPKIISSNGGKKPAVQAVMPNNKKRVIAIPDNRDGHQNGPPYRVVGHEAHGGNNPRPANGGVHHSAPRLRLAQLLDLGRGKQRAAIRDVGTRLLLRSEEHTSELQSRQYLGCRLLLEKKKRNGSRQNEIRSSTSRISSSTKSKSSFKNSSSPIAGITNFTSCAIKFLAASGHTHKIT